MESELQKLFKDVSNVDKKDAAAVAALAERVDAVRAKLKPAEFQRNGAEWEPIDHDPDQARISEIQLQALSAIEKLMPGPHGGQRPGAGRPAVPDAEKKQRKTFTLSAAAIDALKNIEVVLHAKNQSAAVEFLLTDAWKKLDHMHPDQRPDLSKF
jgi:hypothetical protein